MYYNTSLHLCLNAPGCIINSMNRLRVNRTDQGFSLVELLIVIVVIAILATITIVAYTGIQDRASTASLQSDLRQAASLLEQERALDGVYPTSQSEFDSSVDLVASSNNTLLYSYDSSDNTFCLTARSDRSGVADHSISATTGAPAEGACPGHGGGGSESLTPSVIGATSEVGDRNASFTLQLPSGANNYLAIALNHQGADPATAPTGWSYYGNNNDIALWTATSSSSPGTQWQAASHNTPVIILGLNRPVSVSQLSNFTPGRTSPSITTASPALVLRAVTTNIDNLDDSPEIQHSAGIGYLHLGVAYQPQESPGATGPFTFSGSNSESWSNTAEIVAAP